MVGLIIVVVVLLAIAVPSYFIVKQALKAKPLVDAAKARFAEQVGYAFGGPQSILAEDEGRRALPEGQLVFHCAKRSEGNSMVTTQSWWLTSPAAPRASFRLVSRNLVSASQTIANFFGPHAIKVARPYPGPHSLGDPNLDARFALYADDAAAARAVLLQPQVSQALASFTSVVLDVGPDGIMFADPADANLWAAYDAAGLSRFSANAAPMIDVAARVHLAVHGLLSATARAVG
jgi:hypothetical protein